ncbi:DNA gyrase inhibitor YacG [soil metagenome]
MSKIVACPTCRKQGPWLEEKSNPFCSERCKMVDLGKWLGEEHRIASPLTVEDLQELDDLENTPEDK